MNAQYVKIWAIVLLDFVLFASFIVKKKRARLLYIIPWVSVVLKWLLYKRDCPIEFSSIVLIFLKIFASIPLYQLHIVRFIIHQKKAPPTTSTVKVYSRFIRFQFPLFSFNERRSDNFCIYVFWCWHASIFFFLLFSLFVTVVYRIGCVCVFPPITFDCRFTITQTVLGLVCLSYFPFSIGIVDIRWLVYSFSSLTLFVMGFSITLLFICVRHTKWEIYCNIREWLLLRFEEQPKKNI